ncbi:hypothetical protein SPSIL_053590 [Sporomusa silvacetica DSM 10669]|uniref:Uncharacterized protein n=1 Tax=Sporomusa silvacetica DSM 10669 TaxID=1123289 RepID=A0ABZ3ITT4_9FIRM|nr:hypothetical protein [Sporomusa silvacetica]OZC19552.1 hypothetical protein SPSIL_19800 [Sporomusa silvacetica DSM 10669]
MDLQDKIINRLIEKRADMDCPVCGYSKGTTRQNSFVYLPIKDEQDGGITTIRCMYMTCGNCGHITLFDTEVALK